jgi:hypothetical protein
LPQIELEVMHSTDPGVEPGRRVRMSVSSILRVEPVTEAARYPGARALVQTRGVFEEVYAVAESMRDITELVRRTVFLGATPT